MPRREAQTDPKFPLLSLPQELRDMIWGFTFAQELCEEALDQQTAQAHYSWPRRCHKFDKSTDNWPACALYSSRLPSLAHISREARNFVLLRLSVLNPNIKGLLDKAGSRDSHAPAYRVAYPIPRCIFHHSSGVGRVVGGPLGPRDDSLPIWFECLIRDIHPHQVVIRLSHLRSAHWTANKKLIFEVLSGLPDDLIKVVHDEIPRHMPSSEHYTDVCIPVHRIIASRAGDTRGAAQREHNWEERKQGLDAWAEKPIRFVDLADESVFQELETLFKGGSIEERSAARKVKGRNLLTRQGREKMSQDVRGMFTWQHAKAMKGNDASALPRLRVLAAVAVRLHYQDENVLRYYLHFDYPF
ncbi:hypothetical protein OQA88_2305 [Cercophora sp. LCS_1]